MSIAVSTLVWKHSKLSGTSLLILLALADWSDDSGQSYPSIRALGLKARISDRQAQKQVAAICRAGELEVHLGMGPVGQGGRSNLYRIRLERLHPAEVVSSMTPLRTDSGASTDAQRGVTGDTGVEGDGASLATRRGVAQGGKGVSPATPNTSMNHQDTSIGRASKLSTTVEKPEGVDAAVWRDFIDMLKAKRKVVTPTYLESLRAAGASAGLSLARVIGECAARQWVTFDPSWLRGRTASGPTSGAQLDLSVKWGVDAAAKLLGLAQRVDEHRPLFDERVRSAYAKHLMQSSQQDCPGDGTRAPSPPPVTGPSHHPVLTGQIDPEAGLFHAIPKGVVP